MPDLIAGKYEVVQTIGKGGMGTVYKAVQRNLDRVVAIKMLSEDLASDPEFRARFQQEATVVARLGHPNIVAVYDIEPHNHTFCIIMEYLEGENLQAKIDRDVSLPERDVVLIGAQVARALGYAHSQGIIHRDIKPDNVHVTPKGIAKVMDFGIARFLDSKLKTQTGISMGTPKFMSPEQVTGKNVDGQTDLYSLGVCLYYCLAGRPPFDGENAIAVATRHLYEQPEPPSRYNTSITPAVERVIMKALEKQKSERYQDGGEMADALEATLGIRTPIRIAEDDAAEMYAGTTQRIAAMPQYGVEGTEVYVTQRDETPPRRSTPSGARRIADAAKGLGPRILTPMRVRTVDGLDDFKAPPPVHAPTPSGAWRLVTKWWPLLAATFLLVAILLFVSAARKVRDQGPAGTDVSEPAKEKPALSFRNVQEQAANLAGEKKFAEAIALWKDFAKRNPGVEPARVEAEINALTNQLPVTAIRELGARRSDMGGKYSGSRNRNVIARAYLLSAAINPAFKDSYNHQFTLPQVDKEVSKTLSRRAAEGSTAADSVLMEVRQLLEKKDPDTMSAAESRLLDAVEADPENVELWLELGRLYASQGKTDDARVMYQHAQTVTKDPQMQVRLRQNLNDL